MADLQPFVQVARDVLIPEDRDVGIIYLTTEGTPDDWTTPPDPRPYGNPNLLVPVFWKTAFKEAATKLGQWHITPRMAPTARRRVSIVTTPGVSLPKEHERLLRAAFRDCHEVIISQGRQGYSGSSLMRVQPTAGDGSEMPDFMAKAFTHPNAAAEIAHFEGHLAQKLDAQDFVSPDPLRTVVGEGQSMLVSRLVPGRSGEIVTLRDLIGDRPHLAISVVERMGHVLRRAFKGAGPTDASIAKSYLSKLKPELEEKLQSELRLMNWNGISDQTDPLKQYVAWLDARAGHATRVAEVHGDLHADNIVIREDGDLKPVLIDFAHSSRNHAPADLIALAADFLVRVIGPAGGPEQQLVAVQGLMDKAKSTSTPEQAILVLRDLAEKHLTCSRREFVGAMLCRILWIIPRATESGDRKNLRSAADALFRTLSVS
jgi:hypothetical protein